MNRKIAVQMAVGVGLAGLCLYFFFRNADPAQLLNALKQAHYVWLVPVFALTLLSLLCRVWRWKYLLYEAKVISFRGLWTPTIVGFMANSVLPARLGEPIRVVALAQREKVPFTTVLASLVMDRMFDMAAVVIVVMVVFTVMPLDFGMLDQYSGDFPFTIDQIRESVGLVMGGAVAVGIIILLFLYRQPDYTERILRKLLFFLPHAFRERVIGLLETFTNGMHVLGNGRHFLYCCLCTLGVWGTIALAFPMFFYAFDLQAYLDWRVPLIMVACASLGVMIPTPGYLGSYQIMMMVALALVSADIERTAPGVVEAFGIVTWLGTFPPTILMGLVTLAVEGVSLGALRREAEAKVVAHD